MKIDGIILAAGLSKRYGRPKQLVAFRGVPMVRHVLEVALNSDLRRIIIVAGHESDRVRAVLADLLHSPRLKWVLNPEYMEGQSTSIRRGIAALEEDAEAAMFLSCDQPLINPEYLNGLLDAFSATRPLICYPVFQGRRSNPSIFAAALFPELGKLTGDVGGRLLIERYRSRVLEHRVADARRFADVDTEEDLRALENDAAGDPVDEE